MSDDDEKLESSKKDEVSTKMEEKSSKKEEKSQFEERGRSGRDTNSNDEKALRCRVFVGNLATEKNMRSEVEEIFSKFGKIESCSLHNNFGFVQYFNDKDANAAVAEMHGKILFDKRVDVNLAGLRRRPQSKDHFVGAPLKEKIVPSEVLKSSRPPRGRDRSPIRSQQGGSYGRAGDCHPYEQYSRPVERKHDGYYGQRPGIQSYRPIHENQRPLHHRRPPIDCEIVCLAKDLTRYAEEVESRLKSIGIVNNIGYPPSDMPILELIDRIARTGTLYAVVVNEQNAQHRSCTLNILHGTRQEHRNMPLDAALSFVARNFDGYLKTLQEPIGYRAPHPNYTVPVHPVNRMPRPQQLRPDSQPQPHLKRQVPQKPPASISQARPPSEKQMSSEELDAMIERLKREKEEREAQNSKPPPDPERYVELSNQIRETTDVPGTNNYLYNTYPPPSTYNNTESTVPVYQQGTPAPASQVQTLPPPRPQYEPQPAYR